MLKMDYYRPFFNTVDTKCSILFLFSMTGFEPRTSGTSATKVLKKLPKNTKIQPKQQNYAKSGHTTSGLCDCFRKSPQMYYLKHPSSIPSGSKSFFSRKKNDRTNGAKEQSFERKQRRRKNQIQSTTEIAFDAFAHFCNNNRTFKHAIDEPLINQSIHQ